jgi:hypothetical protein
MVNGSGMKPLAFAAWVRLKGCVTISSTGWLELKVTVPLYILVSFLGGRITTAWFGQVLGQVLKSWYPVTQMV